MCTCTVKKVAEEILKHSCARQYIHRLAKLDRNCGSLEFAKHAAYSRLSQNTTMFPVLPLSFIGMLRESTSSGLPEKSSLQRSESESGAEASKACETESFRKCLPQRLVEITKALQTFRIAYCAYTMVLYRLLYTQKALTTLLSTPLFSTC